MQKIQSIDALNIPEDYRKYISEYIQNISDLPFINKVVLFGSCAKGTVTKYSDIDIFVLTSRGVSDFEETQIAFHCLPEYSINTIPIDIIVQAESDFRSLVNSTGMVQQHVSKYGVDLSGLLHQRTGY